VVARIVTLCPDPDVLFNKIYTEHKAAHVEMLWINETLCLVLVSMETWNGTMGRTFSELRWTIWAVSSLSQLSKVPMCFRPSWSSLNPAPYH
jgi:hypothetical protein